MRRHRWVFTCWHVVVAGALLTGCALVRPVVAPPPGAGAYDLVIENGRIVDGSGAPWFYGDIALRGDRIVAITPRGGTRGATVRERIDASGMVVAPGFIDLQGQSGGALLRGDGRLVSMVAQGVTTSILGEGSTPAPLSASMLAAQDARDTVGMRWARTFAGPRGFDAWLRGMESHGTSVNVGSFVGAATLRQFGMGMAQGAATGAALDSMRAAARRAMQDGAFGVASALIYPPGEFATTAELIAIATEISPHGGLYITHMRSEGDKLLEAIDEALRIGREGGVPVELYHLKAAGVRNWPRGLQAIAKIDSARAAGQDVQADMYPYTAGGTGLTGCLPPWSAADGKLFDNLASAQMRARMRAEMEHATTDWENLCELATPPNVLITALSSPRYRQYAGKRLSEIAAGEGKDWIETAMDLIVTERRRVETIYFIMSEDNVRLNLRQPWIKVGTDAGGYDPDSTLALVHPRSYGTFPRILGHYVRDEKLMPLEEAVRKMTSATATRLSLADRGLLKAGMFADIVIFDPATIADRATYEQPHQLAVGVRDVFVNGTAVMRNGRHTNAKPGRALRGPGYRS
ncbi:MAG TPA: D-aminoacylase [Gemmatimonadaceae bacterium]|nr:D-aminoacylase [Gemmatimonadaceae bacterium]